MKELMFKVGLDETNLILEGLGNLPFARVYALVEKIQQQAREQLQGDPGQVVPSLATPSGAVANGVSNEH